MALRASSAGAVRHCPSTAAAAASAPPRPRASAFLPPAVQPASASLAFRDAAATAQVALGRRHHGHHHRRHHRGQVVVALFGLGVPELVVIGGVAALLFGPKQLPELGKNLGKTLKGFQTAAKEFQSEMAAAGEAAAAAEGSESAEERKPAPAAAAAAEAAAESKKPETPAAAAAGTAGTGAAAADKS